MARGNERYEAMIIPKGARIVAGDGAMIELDVQGDLILQESQQGLTSMVSRHGSILIDEGVTVRSDNISAKDLIRIRGKLTTTDLSADEVSLENGTLECDSIEVRSFSSERGKVSSKSIKAENVDLKAGDVEIGSIVADDLNVHGEVKGTVLITNAKKKSVSDAAQLRGNFESDVELLGYLLKYRSTIFSERVLKELEGDAEAKEVRQVLAPAAEPVVPKVVEAEVVETLVEEPAPVVETPPVAEPEVADEEEEIETLVLDQPETAEVEQEVTEPVDAVDEDDPYETRSPLQIIAEKLQEALGERDHPPTIKLVLSGLNHSDKVTLNAIFSRWTENLENELADYPDSVMDIIAEVKEKL